MRKALLSSAFSICISLLVATAWILFTPVPGFALAECTATCGDGSTVTCSGYECQARDGDGCVSRNKYGDASIESCLK